jgi:hypothetical protein
MKRKLLITSIALSFPSLFAAGACSPGTDTNVDGITTGGSSAGTGPAAGTSSTAGSAVAPTGGSGGAPTGGNGGSAPTGGVTTGGGGAST